MKASNLKNYVAAANKIFLTEQHKLRRLQFASDFLNRGDDFWSHLILSIKRLFNPVKTGNFAYIDHENADMKKIIPNCRTVDVLQSTLGID